MKISLHKIGLLGLAALFAAAALLGSSCTEDDEGKLYTVTIVSNGGTNFAPIQVSAGERIPLNKLSPEPITIDGGEFMYWCSDELLEREFDFDTPVTGDMTLYAKWFYVEYTITFETNGAPAIDPLVLRQGSYIDYFRPTYGDKAFGGWYTDKECTRQFDFPMTQVSEDLTLYAKWHDPSPADWFTISDGVLTGCTVPAGTQTVVIPEGVTQIGQWFVLANAGNLTQVTEFVLPQSLTSIEVGAFKGSAITRITIPPHVKTFTSFTFQDCNNLVSFQFEPGSEFESITVNNDLEPVFRTPLLTGLTLPESVTDIDGYCFAPTCTALQSLTFLRSESAPNFHIRGGGSLWLFGGYYPATIYVPNNAKSAYVSALRLGCANDYDYTQMTGILVGF